MRSGDVFLATLMGFLAGAIHGTALSAASLPRVAEHRLDTLQVVGDFEYAPTLQMVFGDTDHDGQSEIILSGSTPALEGVLRILEYQPGGGFAVALEGPNLIPLRAGDIDQDGRSDLIVQVGSQIFVYESTDAQSHPATQVWQSPPISSQLGHAEIADTDGDGALEIIDRFWAGRTRFVVFECEGDNTYTQKFLSMAHASQGFDKHSQPSGIYSAWAGDDLLFDLDADGRPEIVHGGIDGELVIHESTGDDTWELIYADSTGLSSTAVMGGGVDTDGDGKRELFLAGDDQITWERTVFIYQADGDRSFSRVGTLTTFDNATGPQSGAIARLDSEGKPRFVWAVYLQLRFYVAESPGRWELEKVISDPTFHLTVYARDLNRNGRDEIYWLTNNRTYRSLILERPTLPTDVQEGGGVSAATAIRISPSPCRSEARLILEPTIAPRAANWEAFDAAGRLVLDGKISSTRLGWHFPADRLHPGHYFIRITDPAGRPLATGRTTVVR